MDFWFMKHMYLLCSRLVCADVGVHYHLQFIHECGQDKEYREIWNVSSHINSHVYNFVYFSLCLKHVNLCTCCLKCETLDVLLKREKEREREFQCIYFMSSVLDLSMC